VISIWQYKTQVDLFLDFLNRVLDILNSKNSFGVGKRPHTHSQGFMGSIGYRDVLGF